MRLRGAVGLLVALVLGAASPGAAGTTGELRGRVLDAATRAPLAGVKVSIAAPSQSASATTDATGSFSFISLAPDSYTVSLDKQGYDPLSTAGVMVLADQTQTLTFDLTRSLKTIGRVQARSTSDVVRPGTTSDVYSINAAKQTAASAVGGPGGVDFAYSGLATVPGVYIQQGQQGWEQLMSVRGGDPGDVAVELDGIPMSRSSDGGTASTLSSLGQQELQAYTGGTPASADANGLSGYINQVMRTGTRPGFAELTAGVGYPAFYHKLSFEIGGATPNRTFSYYFATSGVNQDYRYCAQDMCGGNLSSFFYPLAVTGKSGSVYDGSSPAYFAPGATYALATTADRETVANVHIGVPHHKDGGRDDVQLLYVTSEIFANFYSSIDDLGGQTLVNQAIGTPTYTDINAYTGQVFAPPDPSKVVTNYFPSSPANRPFDAQIPATQREGNDNGVSVVKLQYQRNFDSRSYLRAFAYTNYSNWFINGPVSEYFNYGGQIGDFEITEHAWGGKAVYENELSGKNLLTATASIEQERDQTYSSNLEGIITTNLVDGRGNCYNFLTGDYASCFTPEYYAPPPGCSSSSSSSGGCPPVVNPAGGLNQYTQYGAVLPGYPSTPALVPGNPPADSPAARKGARWLVTENGAWTDQYDNVIPTTTALSLTDQWRPNERLVVNAGLRAERYDYQLGNAIDGYPARAFWFAAFNRENCYAAGQPNTIQTPIDPLTGQPAPCPQGTSHTNLQNAYPSVATYGSFLPRLGFTYTLSRDAVLRGSVGRYASSPSSSDEQINAYQQNLPSSMAEFLVAGYNTPFHNEYPAIATNADLSLEDHLRGTGYSVKVSPFYRSTSGQVESVPIGFQGDVLGLNVGNQRSYGAELLLTKGDFARDGLSWSLSYAYTNNAVRYADGPTGTNFIDSINAYIQHYNSFTSACATANAQLCGPYGSSNAKPSFQNGSSSSSAVVDRRQPVLRRRAGRAVRPQRLLLAVHDSVEPLPGRGRLQHAQRPHGARQLQARPDNADAERDVHLGFVLRLAPRLAGLRPAHLHRDGGRLVESRYDVVLAGRDPAVHSGPVHGPLRPAGQPERAGAADRKPADRVCAEQADDRDARDDEPVRHLLPARLSVG